jgi:hypothetical protein
MNNETKKNRETILIFEAILDFGIIDMLKEYDVNNLGMLYRLDMNQSIKLKKMIENHPKM